MTNMSGAPVATTTASSDSPRRRQITLSPFLKTVSGLSKAAVLLISDYLRRWARRPLSPLFGLLVPWR
jgi:hypothetical protein